MTAYTMLSIIVLALIVLMWALIARVLIKYGIDYYFKSKYEYECLLHPTTTPPIHHYRK